MKVRGERGNCTLDVLTDSTSVGKLLWEAVLSFREKSQA